MANIKCIPKAIASKLKSEFKKKSVSSPSELAAKIEEVVKLKYNIDIPTEVSSKIIKISTELNTIKEKLGDNAGNFGHLDDTISWIKKQNELNRVIKDMQPASKLDVWLGIIGRSAMLASPKTFGMNIEGNIMTGGTEAIVRRLSTGNITGSSRELAKEYFKMVRKIYKETGTDISRMKNSNDFYKAGELTLGEGVTSAEGVTGMVGSTGRFAEKWIFEGGLGNPDNFFGGKATADSAGLLTKKYNDITKLTKEILKKKPEELSIAEKTLLKSIKDAKSILGNKNDLSKELMQDALRLEPKSILGKEIRLESVNNAKISTLVQNTFFSFVLNKTKISINKYTNSRLGDFLLPFVKTPANVVAMSLDYAGGGVIKAGAALVKGITNGTLRDPEIIRKIVTNMAKSGIGFGGAIAITSQLDSSNFIGAYDPARQQIKELENSNYDAVKIGGIWYSTDLFGPFAAAVSGLMYAKKGEGYIDTMYKYLQGTKDQMLKIPGVDLGNSIYNNLQYNKSKNGTTALKETAKYAAGEIASRTLPAVLGDIAKATDKTERVTSDGTLDSLQNKIPGLREQLPVKTNVFGEAIKTPSVIATILGGSRITEGRDTSITKEVTRVINATETGVTFTDWSKSASKELTQLKEKIGEKKFAEAKIFYGQTLKTELDKLIKNPRYSLMSDEEKLKQINIQDTQSKDKTFSKFNFKYRQEKTKKQPKL